MPGRLSQRPQQDSRRGKRSGKAEASRRAKSFAFPIIAGRASSHGLVLSLRLIAPTGANVVLMINPNPLSAPPRATRRHFPGLATELQSAIGRLCLQVGSRAVALAAPQAGALLGPVFETCICNGEPYLKRMCEFWSSVALMTGRSTGRRWPGISRCRRRRQRITLSNAHGASPKVLRWESPDPTALFSPRATVTALRRQLERRARSRDLG